MCHSAISYAGWRLRVTTCSLCLSNECNLKGFRHHQLLDFNVAGSFNLVKKVQGTKVMDG